MGEAMDEKRAWDEFRPFSIFLSLGPSTIGIAASHVVRTNMFGNMK